MNTKIKSLFGENETHQIYESRLNPDHKLPGKSTLTEDEHEVPVRNLFDGEGAFGEFDCAGL